MVEAPDLPAVGRMTAIAIQAQFAFMGIILFVTGITLDRGVMKRVGQVAFFAGDHRV